MAAPLNAKVVNAFLQPALEVIRRCVQGDTDFERLELSSELPPPPVITVAIQIRGQLVGPVYWTFERPVALKVASSLLGSRGELDLSSPECADAIAELANIIAGNATGALLEAGYSVEVSLPRTRVSQSPAQFREKLPNLVLSTPLGRVKITFGLRAP